MAKKTTDNRAFVLEKILLGVTGHVKAIENTPSPFLLYRRLKKELEKGTDTECQNNRNQIKQKRAYKIKIL